MIRAVHHVSISTPNVDRMLAFYRDLLHLPLVLDVGLSDNDTFDKVVGLPGSRARCVMLQAGNTFIEFWEYAAPAGQLPIANRPVCDAGLTHLCFDLDDALGEFERLTAAGVSFISAPEDLGTVVTCYARDPDGNLVEMRQGKGSGGISGLALATPVLEAAMARLKVFSQPLA